MRTQTLIGADTASQELTPHADQRMSVLALPGSLRHRSWNRALLQVAAARAPAGMSIVVYDELAEIPLFNEDLEAGGPSNLPPPVIRLLQRVRSVDALLIATPEYNQSIPGVLKNTLDWLSRPTPDEVLIGKPVAIMGATAGQWGTRLAQSALRHVLHAAEALVIAQPGLYVRAAAHAFDDAGHLLDDKLVATLDAVLSALQRAVQLRRIS